MRTKVDILASLQLAKMSPSTVCRLTHKGSGFSHTAPTGPSSVSDRDAAAVRATCPIPPACGVYYYEVEIINRGIKGYDSDMWSVSFRTDIYLGRYPLGAFSISAESPLNVKTYTKPPRFAVKDLHLHRLPGWEVGSWGYHGDDGMSFAGQPRSGSPFGPKFTSECAFVWSY